MTPKQEAFARAYVETGNASEAYRQAYDAENMKPDVVKVKACELLKNGNVAVTVNNLKAGLQKRHEITVDTITQMLQDDREMASANGHTSASVAAAMGIAKLHGLILDKAEHTGKNGVPLVPVLNVSLGRD